MPLERSENVRPLVCTKICAAGNDFLCIDHRYPYLPLQERSWIANLCHRRFGLGADGVLLWELSQSADLRMRVFNADGSEAEMCGNGLRAICLFAAMQGLKKPSYCIETLAGQCMAHFEMNGSHKAMITTSMPQAKDCIENILLETPEGVKRIGHYLHVGVPHLLFFLDENAAFSVEKEGRYFRHHPKFAPDGVNVHFITKQEGVWHFRSYERGVEAETWACGSGATAIATYLVQRGLATLPFSLMPYSSIPLTFQASTNVKEVKPQKVAADYNCKKEISPKLFENIQLELCSEALALLTVSITAHGLCNLPCCVEESAYCLPA